MQTLKGKHNKREIFCVKVQGWLLIFRNAKEVFGDSFRLCLSPDCPSESGCNLRYLNTRAGTVTTVTLPEPLDWALSPDLLQISLPSTVLDGHSVSIVVAGIETHLQTHLTRFGLNDLRTSALLMAAYNYQPSSLRRAAHKSQARGRMR